MNFFIKSLRKNIMKSYEIKHKKCNDLNKSIAEKNPETFYVL